MARSARQRGRAVPARRSRLPLWLGLGAVAAIVIVVAIAVYSSQQATPIRESSISVEEAVRPLTAPTGTTEEGFAYKGSPDAPVEVIEYGDFQCPACAYAFRELAPTIDQQYIETGQVQFIFHDFPLSQHANAVPAAEAARCAGAQDAFWPMHDLLYSRQSEWSNDSNVVPRLVSYAGELGLDSAAFEQCMSDGTYRAAVQDAAAAATAANIQSTPTFLVNGQVVAADQLQAAIDAALAAGGN